MCCTIWYHLYNLKNVKNTHRGVLLSVKLQALACNFTKINTSPWVFFTFLKLYKWYQITQRITYTQICAYDIHLYIENFGVWIVFQIEFLLTTSFFQV